MRDVTPGQPVPDLAAVRAVIEDRFEKVGQLADGLRSTRGLLRSRQDELLSGVAQVVTMACVAGLDRDRDWCVATAAAAGQTWTATSDAHPRAALCRVVSRGLIAANRARRMGHAVEHLLAAREAEFARMSVTEREQAIAMALQGGITQFLPKAAKAARAARSGPVLIGPGVEHLAPGAEARAVLRRLDEGTVELVFLTVPEGRVILRPGRRWDNRYQREISKVEGAIVRGSGDDLRVEAPASAELLRHVNAGALEAVSYTAPGVPPPAP
ncbi:hypothetical protein ACFQX4_20990 [Roseomonas sp. GCM10028921]